MNVLFSNGARAFGGHPRSRETAPAIVDAAIGGVGGSSARKPHLLGVAEAGEVDAADNVHLSELGKREVDRLWAAEFIVRLLPYSEEAHADGEPRGDRHGMLVAVRGSAWLDEPEPVALTGGRRAFVVPVRDTGTGEPKKVVIAHPNDRPERNVEDARALLRYAAAAGSGLLALVGDMNTADPKSIRRAPSYYVVRTLAGAVRHGIWPARAPESHTPRGGPARIGDMALRADVMLDGEAFAVFRAGGWHNADPEHRPTKGGIMQVDYALTPNGPASVSDYAAVPIPGADHLGVYASFA